MAEMNANAVPCCAKVEESKRNDGPLWRPGRQKVESFVERIASLTKATRRRHTGEPSQLKISLHPEEPTNYGDAGAQTRTDKISRRDSRGDVEILKSWLKWNQAL